ncbi:TetR/AcrR family transcriptional regulator [Marivivens sp.]|jgi:AcrR family transcriptional regulator|uniref:TetR/AcrR family transcriptional regulator n=1 Tax=Marivivens sp. TaxID=1978374 RepID=UPI001857CC85|nr:TetR/AcrR family transcriptional regulator [Marivivens sp.]MCL7406253.1 TetR/AcrR family transcriptional regulator [Marivivens geojensis]NVK07262.1 TetR/AcrR family transcriptional regulator [Marivivens sp.]
MDEPKQNDRRIQIETAAYGLLSLKGYKATSMLEVAKRAKASNETLYKWYGNKQGLFLSMVERSVAASRELLVSSLEGDQDLATILDTFGPQLLQMLTSQRTIVLNRAAAGDVHDTGMLGRTINEGGRDAILPILAQVFDRSEPKGMTGYEAAELYLDILISDLQIRRVIGVLPMLSETEVKARSDRARDIVLKLIA